MTELKEFVNGMSKRNESIWNKIVPFFKEEKLLKSEYFAEENKTARHIAFLKTGVVRAFFTNQEAKSYN